MVAHNSGAVENCSAEGSVKITSEVAKVGGLIGFIAYGSVADCSFKGSLTSIENEDLYLGGLVGHIRGSKFLANITISHCYADADISSQGQVAGGIVGVGSRVDISNCSVQGNIESKDIAGGIMGKSEGNVNISNAVVLTDKITVTNAESANYSAICAVSATNTQINNASYYHLLKTGIEGQESYCDEEAKYTALKNISELTEKLATLREDGLYNISELPDYIYSDLEGQGTSENPYKISSVADLYKLSYIISNLGTGIVSDDYAGEYKVYALTKDIDMEGVKYFTPIGNEKGNDKAFESVFDGKGYEIQNMEMKYTQDESGLFHRIGEPAIIRNLGMTNCDVSTENSTVGTMAGKNYGKIENCYVKGNVVCPNTSVANSQIGGMAGYNKGVIKNSCFYGNIDSEGSTYVGGIAGKEDAGGSVEKSFVMGTVLGKADVGGIVGGSASTGRIENSLALNEKVIMGSAENKVGRIASPSVTPVLVGNYAFSEMKVGTGEGTAYPDKTNEKDIFGCSVASKDIFSQLIRIGFTDIKTSDLPAYLGATATETATVEIGTLDELLAFAGAVNSSADYSTGKYFKLTNDIDISSIENWTPIGNDTKSFNGIFDGNGFAIKGLKMGYSASECDYQGLFGYVGRDGVVRNLGVADCNIDTNALYLGGIAGLSDGLIQSCYVTGNIKNNQSSAQTGAIVGGNASKAEKLDKVAIIENCHSNCTIEASGIVGGIVGVNDYYNEGAPSTYIDKGIVRNCYSEGNIKNVDGSEGAATGGIAGINNKIVENCVALNEQIKANANLCKVIGKKNGTDSDGLSNYSWSGLKLVNSADASANPTQSGNDYNGEPLTGISNIKEKLAEIGFPNAELPAYLSSEFEGEGTEEKPYKIENAAQLKALADKVNSGDTAYSEGKYYELKNNIDLSDYDNWTPIGTETHPFKSLFSGSNLQIKNMTVNNPASQYQGLFGYVSSGSISYVTLVDSSVTGDSKVGGIVGFLDTGSVIKNCAVNNIEVIAMGSNDETVAGLIAGESLAEVSNCIAAGNAEGQNADTNSTVAVAGVVGLSDSGATVTNCTNLAEEIKATKDYARITINDTGNENALSGNSSYSGTSINNGTSKVILFESSGATENGKDIHAVSEVKRLIQGKFEVPDYITKTLFEGEGTESEPYLISTATQLKFLADRSAVGDTALMNSNIYYKLTEDIDLSGIEWHPIGIEEKPFSGHFDGDYHSIKNPTMSESFEGKNANGLFGSANNATIKNLAVVDCNISLANSSDYVGAILANGTSSVTIENCYSTGNVEGARYVGGIVGRLATDSEIKNCYSFADVLAVDSSLIRVGGIAGDVYQSKVLNCYAAGSVESRSTSAMTGGIAGKIEETTLSGCVSLTPSLKSPDTAISRIANIFTEESTPSVLSSNYALSTILIGAAGSQATVSAGDAKAVLTGEHGLSKTSAEMKDVSDAMWAVFTPENGWNTLASGYLPALKSFANQPSIDLKGATTGSMKVTINKKGEPWNGLTLEGSKGNTYELKGINTAFIESDTYTIKEGTTIIKENVEITDITNLDFYPVNYIWYLDNTADPQKSEETVMCLKNENITQPSSIPSVSDKILKGYYTTSTGSALFEFDTPLTEETTIHARFGKELTDDMITVNGGNAVPYDKSGPEPTVQIVGFDTAEEAVDLVYEDNENVGTAKVKVTPKDSCFDLAGTTIEKEFTIEKAEPEATFPTAAGIVYGQKLANATLGAGIGEGSFKWEDENVVPDVENTGYNVIFTPTDDANYLTKAAITAVTVAKADGNVTVSKKISKVADRNNTYKVEFTVGVEKSYDGKAPTGKVTITNTTGRKTLNEDVDLVSGSAIYSWDNIVSQNLDADVYSISIVYAGDDNYKSGNTSTTVNLSKQPVDISGVTVANKIYDGKNVVPVGNVKAVLHGTDNDITSQATGFKYSYEGTGTTDYDPSENAPKDAGTYKLVVMVSDEDSVYTGASEAVEFTVSKAALPVKPKDLTVTVNTTVPAFELEYKGIVGADTLAFESGEPVFKLTTNDDVEVTDSAISVAGTYKIVWENMQSLSFKDGAGKKGNYEITTAAIGILNVKAVSSGGGSGSTAAPTISTEVVNGKIVVNGKTESTATENKVVIDKAQLGTVIEAAKAGNTLEIEVADNKAQATVQLPIENIEKMAEKEMVFAVKSGNVSYAIPAAAIDIKSLSKDLGAVNLADISLNVTIIKLDEAAQKQANEAVNAYGAEIVGVPIEFKMEAAYGDKTIELKIFGKYVQRIFEVTAEQVKNVTTAVVIEKDGSLRPVPTSIVNENGKWGIKISSKTNSTYALISNEKSFKDAEGKWYEDAVTEMASRCIVDGKTETSFAGDSKITRAEFATILVRALGLDGSNSAQFTDVKATSWYADAVGTAVEYGLVKGYADGSFAPNANITRQEAMIMIQCGAAIADYSGNTGTVTGFSDSAKIAKWAKEAVAFNVGSGLIKGSNGELNLSENISRAETAAVVLRLLQKAEIIDTRAVV